MNEAKTSGRSAESLKTQSDLQYRYREIGISAVLAALPYRSESKNSAYAPAEARD